MVLANVSLPGHVGQAEACVMMRIGLAALMAAGVGACTAETRVVRVEEDACSTYGFRVGTPEYHMCRDREAAGRRAGVAYSQAAAVADARAACRSYGLTPYSERYDACVRQEYAARGPV